MIATLSLVADFWFVQNALREANNAAAEADEAGGATVEESAVLTRASRAARAGTKIGRLLKLTRLMRVSKVVKLCGRGSKDQGSSEQPSDMARRMAETITGRVIMIVLVMLFCMPYLEQVQLDHFPSYGLDSVELADGNVTAGMANGNTQPLTAAAHDYVNFARGESGEPDRVIRVACGRGNNSVVYEHPNYVSILADTRVDFTSIVAGSSARCVATWDDTSTIRHEARLSILRTCFVVIMLGCGSILFGRDAEQMSNRITTPLRFLSEDMSKVATLELDDVEMFHSSVREVNKMQDAFQRMKTALSSFKKFMPEAVVRNLLKAGRTMGLKVERKYLTIFFSNIANFESVSAEMETLELMEFLSEYFGAMAALIEEHDGTLIEFVGDEILALWNAPLDVSNHEADCAETALKMQAKVLEMYETSWKQRGWPWIDVKIGINAANVFVGNLGAPDRMKYGVLGDGVNMAARLQMLNRRYSTDVMVTQAIIDNSNVSQVSIPRCTCHRSHNCLCCAQNFRTRLLDVVAVKGKTIGVRVHECLSHRENAADAELHDFLIEKYA